MILLVIGSFVTDVYVFLDRTHIFSIIVLTLLCGIVYDIEVGKRSPAVKIFRSDYEATAALDGFLRELPVRHVDILGAGLSTRYTLIARLASDGVRVRAFVQNPSAAIDEKDGNRFQDLLIKLRDNIPSDCRMNAEIIAYSSPATVRAVVLYNARRHCLGALLSWYTYEGRSNAITADAWPVIWASPSSSEGRELLAFVEALIIRRAQDGGQEVALPSPEGI